jgi:hypothetical protein
MTSRLGFVAFVLLLVACADDSEVDGAALADLASPAASLGTCVRTPKAANRTRKVVVSHPIGTSGQKDGKSFEVLDLEPTGALRRTGVRFELGMVAENPIVFTPDGEIGMVPQNDGTIGIFRFDASGMPHVVDAALNGGFWASAITMSPNGDRAYVLDGDTADHHGGVYTLEIGCDGGITPKGLAFPSSAPSVMSFLPQSRSRAVLVAKQALTSTDGNDAFTIDTTRPALLAQGSAFGDVDGDRSSMAITPDGKYALVGDDDIRAGNRLAVVSLSDMKNRQVLTVDAPFSVVTSVYGNAALVVDGDDFNEITTLSYRPANATEPFAVVGPLAYTLPPPQLPGVAVQITRGDLKGRVLVAELAAVRQVQFRSNGTVVDVDETTFGDGDADSLGTLGVQP